MARYTMRVLEQIKNFIYEFKEGNPHRNDWKFKLKLFLVLMMYILASVWVFACMLLRFFSND